MSQSVSRRDFARLSASAAGLLSLPAAVATAQPGAATAMPHSRSFPAGFLWGSATASYQVEGAVKEDGRGTTVWDTFSHTPGKVANGDTGDVADDSYHRYKEDIALMKAMGLKTCRFSVAWSRIFPSGAGAMNAKGMGFYNRFVDELLANGIAPYCTLYHWDLPQALEDKGGWQNRVTAQLFADYAGTVAGTLSDRCRHFMTMNEIRTFIELGYGNGTHAPGLKLAPQAFAQANHYAVLGHGLAVQAIRASARPGTKVGLADNLEACVPVIDAPEHVTAARKATREENASYLTVIKEGKYTEQFLQRLGADAPKFTPEEMKTIGAPLDFLGINVYQASYVRAQDSAKGYEVMQNPRSFPHMESPWLTLGPEALYWMPRFVTELWKVPEIFVTENGCSSADVLTPKGEVLDTDRCMFLRNYLTHLQRATAEGYPVKGYFCWSLLDNYEWADGYDKRFGITYVDFKTQKRTPKLSSALYSQTIRTNSVS